jgi:hypothetical protein
MAKTPKKELPPHYLVTVAGTYAYKGEEGKLRGNYRYTIPVPVTAKAVVPEKRYNEFHQEYWADTVKTMNIQDIGIMSYLLKNKIIEQRIKKDNPAMTVILTHTYENIIGSSPEVRLPNDPMVLNKSQLVEFVKKNGWPIETKLFTSISELRTAVRNYQESPESYIIFETAVRRRKSGLMAFGSVQEELEAFYDGAQPQSAVSDDSPSEEFTL